MSLVNRELKFHYFELVLSYDKKTIVNIQDPSLKSLAQADPSVQLNPSLNNSNSIPFDVDCDLNGIFTIIFMDVKRDFKVNTFTEFLTEFLNKSKDEQDKKHRGKVNDIIILDFVKYLLCNKSIDEVVYKPSKFEDKVNLKDKLFVKFINHSSCQDSFNNQDSSFYHIKIDNKNRDSMGKFYDSESYSLIR